MTTLQRPSFPREKAVALATSSCEPLPEFDDKLKHFALERLASELESAAKQRRRFHFLFYEELLCEHWNGKRIYAADVPMPSFLCQWLDEEGYTYAAKDGGFHVIW